MTYKPFGKFGREWPSQDEYLMERGRFCFSKDPRHREALAQEWKLTQRNYAATRMLAHLEELKGKNEPKKTVEGKQKKQERYAPFGKYGRTWSSKEAFANAKLEQGALIGHHIGINEKAAGQIWVKNQREFAKQNAREALEYERMAKKTKIRKPARDVRSRIKQRLRKGLPLR